MNNKLIEKLSFCMKTANEDLHFAHEGFVFYDFYHNYPPKMGGKELLN